MTKRPVWTDPQTGETFEVVTEEELGDLGDLEFRYTRPSDEPLTWDRGGLCTLQVAIMALNLQLIRGNVRNASGIYRRRVSGMNDAWAKLGIETLLKGKIKKEMKVFGFAFPGGPAIQGMSYLGVVLKESLKWVSLVFQIFRGAKLQKEIEEALRRAAIQTQRGLLRDQLNRAHNANSRLMEWVSTRR